MNDQGSINAVALIGRVMLATIFVWTGIEKFLTYAPTLAYMEKFHVPGALLPAVIGLEITGGLLVAIGWQTRIVAAALAVFSVLTAACFHANWNERAQVIQTLKNIAISGGFLILIPSDLGRWSLDGWQVREKRKS